jgi:DHA1 family bicyclomycin/chloramphenicol resistance-like MFS transporter
VAQTALILSILLSIAQWVAAGAGENMYVFLFILMLNMSMIGLIGANFSSIAMEPFGRIAGTAASFQTSVRTLISASIGAVIGHAYDGTTLPLALGFFIGGVAALLLIIWGEKGRLFTRPNAPHRPQPRA